MDSNPFRPAKRETYEQQLDLAAPPPKLVEDSDDLVDVGLSGSHQSDASSALMIDQQPKFLETSASSATGAPRVQGGVMGAAPSAPTNNSQSGTGATPSAGVFSRLCGWISVEYYQPYFDVSTSTVLERIKGGVSPHKKDLFATTSEAPADLYGAFWISLTLVFLMGATSNLNSYLVSSANAKEPWDRDYRLLTFASTMIFIYTFVIPFILWGVSLYVGVDPRPSLVKMIGIYGYTLVVFIPASLLCVIPSAPVQWIVVVLAGALSGVVLVRNLHTIFGTSYSPLSQADTESQQIGTAESPRTKTSFLLISAAAVVHAVFALLLKLFFFQGADLASVVDNNSGK